MMRNGTQGKTLAEQTIAFLAEQTIALKLEKFKPASIDCSYDRPINTLKSADSIVQ